VASLKNGTTDVYVHSKLMIVDDELVLIGSANVGQRSMTYDSELQIGVVDSAGTFARALRMAIWQEHTGRAAASLEDPAAAIGLFRDDVAASSGHVKPYPVDPRAVYPATPGSTRPPTGHARIIRLLIDPYAGPRGGEDAAREHAMTAAAGLPLIKTFRSEVFPIDRLDPGGDLVELLSKIRVTEYQQQVFDPGAGGRFDVGLAFADEVVLHIVGLEGFALVFGGAASTAVSVGMTMRPTGWEVSPGAGARLRFPRSFLKPVVRHGDAWVDDPSRPFAELHIAAGMLIDQDWNVSFDGPNAFRLDPAMIADSGLVLEGEIALDLSEATGLPESAALGLPPTWRGGVFRSLQVHLPDAFAQAVPVENLALTKFHIGTGGVTGTIGLAGTPPDGAIGGFPFRPTSLAIELEQSCLVRAEIQGGLALASFDQPLGRPLDITAGFDLGGNLTAAVAAERGVSR
jgi:hypothetical protein